MLLEAEKGGDEGKRGGVGDDVKKWGEGGCTEAIASIESRGAARGRFR